MIPVGHTKLSSSLGFVLVQAAGRGRDIERHPHVQRQLPCCRVAWLKRCYENASLAATERWTAILSVVLNTPHDAERLRKNPLGVFFHPAAPGHRGA
jgi:hypothetical protein